MELIPILSLIILVATISTFILAIGAYILYKIRERKGKKGVAGQPDTIEAELVTPTKVVAETRTTLTGEPIYTTATERETRLRPTFVPPRETRTRTTRTNITTRYTAPITKENIEPEQYTSAQKFKRYTTNTNVGSKVRETRNEESLKWR
jgi:hypothetical protein